MLKQHFEDDDKKLLRIYEEYKAGRMTSGELKEYAVTKAAEFYKGFEKKFVQAQKKIKQVKFLRN